MRNKTLPSPQWLPTKQKINSHNTNTLLQLAGYIVNIVKGEKVLRFMSKNIPLYWLYGNLNCNGLKCFTVLV